LKKKKICKNLLWVTLTFDILMQSVRYGVKSRFASIWKWHLHSKQHNSFHRETECMLCYLLKFKFTDWTISVEKSLHIITHFSSFCFVEKDCHKLWRCGKNWEGILSFPQRALDIHQTKNQSTHFCCTKRFVFVLFEFLSLSLISMWD
jgi:hypothetical protein